MVTRGMLIYEKFFIFTFVKTKASKNGIFTSFAFTLSDFRA
jgi:hypothetical protein